MSAAVAITFSLRGMKKSIDVKGGKDAFDKTLIYQIFNSI